MKKFLIVFLLLHMSTQVFAQAITDKARIDTNFELTGNYWGVGLGYQTESLFSYKPLFVDTDFQIDNSLIIGFDLLNI